MVSDNHYRAIVAAIIRRLEGEVESWAGPWETGVDDDFLAGGRPLRHTGETGAGQNVVQLWSAQVYAGYVFPTWMTEEEARAYNGTVRAGENGETLFYARRGGGSFMDDGAGQLGMVSGLVRWLRGEDVVEVFNVDQIDGLPPRFYRHYWEIHPTNLDERDPHFEAFIRDLGVVVRHEVNPYGEGAEAEYSRLTDEILMPPWELFHSGVDYYETLAHEVVHWAISSGRPADPGWPMSDEREAREELIAEVGSAFLCADLGVSPAPRDGHVSYIAEWLPPGDPRVHVIFVGTIAEAAVRWSHQEAPGYRLEPDTARRGVPASEDDERSRAVPDEDRHLIAARDARRFVAAVEVARTLDDERDPAWQREVLALLVEADGIDLDMPGVRAAIEAEVAVAGAGRASVEVDAAAYIETFRRETLRQLGSWVSESYPRWDRGFPGGRWM